VDKRSAIKPEPVVQLSIQSLNSESQGVARMDGLAVFIPGTVPGDVVEGVIESRKDRYAIGRVVRLIVPSSDRVRPFCKVADRCGGCTLQPMEYRAQLAFKRQQVISALTRIGGFENESVEPLVRPVLGMRIPRQYRSKVQFPVTGMPGRPKIGFYASRSHQVVDHDECDIQHPIANAVRAAIRQHMIEHGVEPYREATHDGLLRHIVVRIGFATGQVMVILVINGEHYPAVETLIGALKTVMSESSHSIGRPFTLQSLYLNHHRQRSNLVLSDKLTLIMGEPQIEEQILGIRYLISPLAFFQVNPAQTEVLYQTALDYAGLTSQETALDLYCGTGSISLLLARAARRVIGIEVVPQAIEDARVNAERNGLTGKASFLCGKAEDLLPKLVAEGLCADVAVVDPPRKGCDLALLESIRTIRPSRLVYVSCNPATLARDLAVLAQNGLYQIQAVQPVDLFPWTGHVETVVLMSRGEVGKA